MLLLKEQKLAKAMLVNFVQNQNSAVIYDKAKATALELNPHLLPKVIKADGKFNLELNGSTKLLKFRLQLHPVERDILFTLT